MVGGVKIGSVVVARHRAQSVADLAALAARNGFRAARQVPAGEAAALTRSWAARC